MNESESNEKEENAKKNKKAFAELIKILDDKSVSLILREAADYARKALQILRGHYASKGKPCMISLYTDVTTLQKANGYFRLHHSCRDSYYSTEKC